MGFHRNVDGLKCSFEQCKVGSKKLVDIRQHIRQAHSVKNPSLGTHFSDEYSTKPAITKQLFDAKEADLASIYDCLDDLIDKDVLGDVERKKAGGTVFLDHKNIQDYFLELDSIKEETNENVVQSPRKTRATTAKKSLSKTPPNPGKRKRTSERLIVKIRNKKERLSALSNQANDSSEELENMKQELH